MKSKYISIKEFADIFGISTRTVHNWINEGLINIIQIKKGGIIFIPKSEIRKIRKVRKK